MDIKTIHGFVANAVSIFTLLITLYALLKYWRQQALSSDFWGAVVIGEGLMVLQGLVGVVLLIEGAFPAQWVHLLYGATSVLAWPVTYTYTRNQPDQRESLVWMIVSGLLFGVTLRARATG